MPHVPRQIYLPAKRPYIPEGIDFLRLKRSQQIHPARESLISPANLGRFQNQLLVESLAATFGSQQPPLIQSAAKVAKPGIFERLAALRFLESPW